MKVSIINVEKLFRKSINPNFKKRGGGKNIRHCVVQEKNWVKKPMENIQILLTFKEKQVKIRVSVSKKCLMIKPLLKDTVKMDTLIQSYYYY